MYIALPSSQLTCTCGVAGLDMWTWLLKIWIKPWRWTEKSWTESPSVLTAPSPRLHQKRMPGSREVCVSVYPREKTKVTSFLTFIYFKVNNEFIKHVYTYLSNYYLLRFEKWWLTYKLWTEICPGVQTHERRIVWPCITTNIELSACANFMNREMSKWRFVWIPNKVGRVALLL